MAENEDRDLYSGLFRFHVLHHACEEPIFGLGILEELLGTDTSSAPERSTRFCTASKRRAIFDLPNGEAANLSEEFTVRRRLAGKY